MIEQAIKKAIEGGFGDLTVTQYRLFEDGHLHWCVYTCKPKFWQALGKALGWNKKPDAYYTIDSDGGDRSYEFIPHWRHMQHVFIDHLAEGKSPDEFFNQLLK